jgi:hypothetical protein
MIQEIIILSNTGIPLFCYNFQENLSKEYKYQLIASYFDQICRFTKYGFKESLNTLKMDKSLFYFYTHPYSHFHLIFKCESGIDEKKFKKKSIDKVAKQIFDKFLNKFRKELVNFNGNISCFKKFSKDIEEMLRTKGILRNFVLRPF